MKTKYLRTLVRFRKYANTRKGEKVIVRTLTVLGCVLLVFDNWQYIMKRVLNYLACTALLFVAVVLILSGSVAWTLVGFAWSFGLYMWGLAWPNFWKMYWVSNIKILARFNCL